MDALGALGTVAGMGVHGMLGASATTDFGRKGMYAGGAFGAASFLAGQAVSDEEDGAMGAAMAGMISGSMQSAFSTAQEVYAYHNPGSMAALSSVNTTTSATAYANLMQAPFTKEGREDWKNLRNGTEANGFKKQGALEAAFNFSESKLLTTDNVLTDATRMGMVFNDLEGGADKMLRFMGIDRGDGDFSPRKALQGQIEDMLHTADVADNGGPWFSNERTEIDVEQKTFFGHKMDEDGKRLKPEYYDADGKQVDITKDMDPMKAGLLNDFGVGKDEAFRQHNVDENKTKYYGTDENGERIEKQVATKKVVLEGNETMDERMAKYLDANKHAYDGVVQNFAQRDRDNGLTPRYEDFDGYKNHLTSMDGGAHGTYKELKHAGFYDKDKSLLSKSLAYSTETMYGSPAWARTLDKQIESGKTQVEHYTDDKNNKKVRLKGGGKTRAASLAIDVLTGGAVNAAINVGMYAAATPFRAMGGNDQAIASNNAYNPI